MALTKITGEGVGALDTITVGDGSAADKKILFDGNAQDFHIGLDDSADSLTIGLGSALGTTSHMVIDANGHITKPLQPAFHADKNGTNQENLTDSFTKVTFGTERYDVNSDYNTSNSTFTAPVTGKYLLHFNLRLQNIDTASAYYVTSLATSNRNYRQLYSNDEWAGDVTYWTVHRTIIADMDAGDTASLEINFQGGAGGAFQTDIDGNVEYSTFSGYLLS